MIGFSRVCQQLESVPFHRGKAGCLAAYLQVAPAEDATWALFLLLGGQLPRLLPNASLRDWILAESQLPAWLLDECREQAGDFAETVALLGEASRPPAGTLACREEKTSLSAWVEERVLGLAEKSEADRQACVRDWWRAFPVDITWAALALAIGRFPVQVSRRIAEEAVREALGDPAVRELDARIASRLTRLPAASQLELFTPAPR